VRRSKERSW
jgi:hypothetical protein